MDGTTIATVVLSVAVSVTVTAIVTNIRCYKQLLMLDNMFDELLKNTEEKIDKLITQIKIK
ncbi:MAG: hypothetical protein HFE63_01485 [Clostridiales bacterium]|nr:hypothetical protein [Clostridiales bacterium]